ncbi:MAG: hypothetical protein IIY40_07570, partial [Firmicutes bacterium]|nr:hypothetical protein [Bacillota bacterium]
FLPLVKAHSLLLHSHGVSLVASQQTEVRFSVRSSVWGYALFIAKQEVNELADTMGTKEASDKWGYKQSTISRWCREGLICNASQDGPYSPWHIPKDTPCPKPIKKKEERR